MSLPTDVRALLHPPQFTSSRWRNVPHEGRLRSVGCKGSRPRCAAMYILRITGCLLLRCLSCCSRARGSCGGICPHTDTPPIAVKPTKLACLRRAEGHKDGSALTHTLIVSLCAGRGSCRTVPPIPRTLWRAWWSTPPLRLRSASRCTNGVCLFILYHYCLRLHLARCSG